MARKVRLADRKASLEVREREISLREEKLEATLRTKDDELEALVCQCTEDLEDKHEAALNVVVADSSAQLKKLTDELAAVSAVKTELDRQVSKLAEDLARSTKELQALKEEAWKAEILLADVSM